MKASKKIVIHLLITGAIAISASVAQAEGLLGGIFGSNDSAGFKTLLSHVPANTSYLLANKKPMPDDVMEFQLQRIQQIMQFMPNSSKDKKQTIDKASVKKTKIDPSNKDDSDKSKLFFKALFEDISSKLQSKKIAETGLSTKAHSIIYGIDTLPVFRVEIANKDALMATLKRAEEKSGFKLELTKCEEMDCFISQDKKSEAGLAAVLLNDHVALSVFPPEKKEAMLKHLAGKSSPEKVYSAKNWDNFLADNKFSGYGDGFINLKMLFEKNKPLIINGIKEGMTTSKGGKIDKGAVEGCLAVAKEHIDHVPGILFGTKDLQKTKMDYQLVVKTSPVVSSVLQTVANKSNIAKRSENPIMDLALNINFANLGKALTQYSVFLATSGEKNKCKEIDPMKIRKSMGGVMMAMNMGLGQLKSIYFAVDEVELNDKMQPKKVDAFISIGTDDPNGLVAMLAMVNPGFATLKVPADGSVVKIPKELIPSKGKPVPPLSLSRGKNALNVMVGNDKPSLLDYKADKPEIMSFGMDGKRYYEKLGAFMQALPVTGGEQIEQKEALDLITSMGKVSGQFKEEIYADKRGLVIDYHVQY
jgi:hypothetical protein